MILRSILFGLISYVIFGLAYPFAMVGIGQLVMPYQANGNLLMVNHKVVGSRYVGQNFLGTKYFWGRPSATLSVKTGKPKPYNAFASAPSNNGPTNKALVADVKRRIARLLKFTPGLHKSQIPMDLVTSSGSGLDPDISVQAAMIQIPRVAKATGLSSTALKTMIQANTTGRTLGVFGPRVVNVLTLNLSIYKRLHHL